MWIPPVASWERWIDKERKEDKEIFARSFRDDDNQEVVVNYAQLSRNFSCQFEFRQQYWRFSNKKFAREKNAMLWGQQEQPVELLELAKFSWPLIVC